MKSVSSYSRLRARVILLAVVVALYLLYYKYSNNNNDTSNYSPHLLYADLHQKEEQTGRKFLESLHLIDSQKDPKFVLFRQHEGADFGNQVSSSFLHLDIFWVK